MDTFTGISRIKINELSALMADSAIAYLPTDDRAVEIPFTPSAVFYEPECSNSVSKAIGNAYVDLVELDEALCLYYVGGLDYVDPTQVNAPLPELIPGKPLISQLDQDAMSRALSALSAGDRRTIELVHRQKVVDPTYAEALLTLSEEIAKNVL